MPFPWKQCAHSQQPLFRTQGKSFPEDTAKEPRPKSSTSRRKSELVSYQGRTKICLRGKANTDVCFVIFFISSCMFLISWHKKGRGEGETFTISLKELSGISGSACDAGILYRSLSSGPSYSSSNPDFRAYNWESSRNTQGPDTHLEDPDAVAGSQLWAELGPATAVI